MQSQIWHLLHLWWVFDPPKMAALALLTVDSVISVPNLRFAVLLRGQPGGWLLPH
jgi:hypothetical protein